MISAFIHRFPDMFEVTTDILLGNPQITGEFFRWNSEILQESYYILTNCLVSFNWLRGLFGRFAHGQLYCILKASATQAFMTLSNSTISLRPSFRLSMKLTKSIPRIPGFILSSILKASVSLRTIPPISPPKPKLLSFAR